MYFAGPIGLASASKQQGARRSNGIPYGN